MEENIRIAGLLAAMLIGSFVLAIVLLKYHRTHGVGIGGVFLSLIGFLSLTAGIWQTVSIGIEKEKIAIELGRLGVSTAEAKDVLTELGHLLEQAEQKGELEQYNESLI